MGLDSPLQRGHRGLELVLLGCPCHVIVGSSLGRSGLHLLKLFSGPLLLSEPHALSRRKALHVFGLQKLIVLEDLLRLDLFADGESGLKGDLALRVDEVAHMPKNKRDLENIDRTRPLFVILVQQ